MAAKFSNVSSRYGAPMGRVRGEKPTPGELCNLHRVPLDYGGYDPGGAYWGWSTKPGQLLWRLQCAGGDHYTRAACRAEAFQKLTHELGVDFRVRKVTTPTQRSQHALAMAYMAHLNKATRHGR